MFIWWDKHDGKVTGQHILDLEHFIFLSFPVLFHFCELCWVNKSGWLGFSLGLQEYFRDFPSALSSWYISEPSENHAQLDCFTLINPVHKFFLNLKPTRLWHGRIVYTRSVISGLIFVIWDFCTFNFISTTSIFFRFHYYLGHPMWPYFMLNHIALAVISLVTNPAGTSRASAPDVHL